MLKRNRSSLWVFILLAVTLILPATLSVPSVAHADESQPTPDNGNCVSCHEDLYFLHDTGKWFCLKESPMACVDCHGGNPATFTKEAAHVNRSPHPVINEDISKCQECHPDECYERVNLFDQSAGIGKVLVAVPYVPVSNSKNEIPATSREESGAGAGLMDFIPLLVLGIGTLIIFTVYLFRQPRREKS